MTLYTLLRSDSANGVQLFVVVADETGRIWLDLVGAVAVAWRRTIKVSRMDG
jgi:hypothetical protein